MADLNVVQFPVPEYRQPATMLRNIADEIDEGKYGEVGSIGVVVFGDTMEIFGGGSDSDGPTIALLFQAAGHRFAKELERHGRDE
jgi:hypothetical protein